MDTADYSWCYCKQISDNCSKKYEDIDYSYCTMCDEHYIYCDDDCMIDYH